MNKYQESLDWITTKWWFYLMIAILMPVKHRLEHTVEGNFAQKKLGVQSLPIDKIVSSTGRYRDFDLAFLPRHKETEDRWVNIARAQYNGVILPPPTIYKVGEIYIVEDGNHRISVARAGGQKTISGVVIEIDSSVLTPEPSCTRLGFKV